MLRCYCVLNGYLCLLAIASRGIIEFIKTWGFGSSSRHNIVHGKSWFRGVSFGVFLHISIPDEPRDNSVVLHEGLGLRGGGTLQLTTSSDPVSCEGCIC